MRFAIYHRFRTLIPFRCKFRKCQHADARKMLLSVYATSLADGPSAVFYHPWCMQEQCNWKNRMFRRWRHSNSCCITINFRTITRSARGVFTCSPFMRRKMALWYFLRVVFLYFTMRRIFIYYLAFEIMRNLLYVDRKIKFHETVMSKTIWAVIVYAELLLKYDY